jgi:uncharacterized coiled-coil protein SlyX
MAKRSDGRIQGYVLLVALFIVAATAAWNAYAEEEVGMVTSEEVPVLTEDEPKPGWFKRAYNSAKEKFNARDAANARIRELEIQLADQQSTMLGHDKLLQAAADQNDKTAAHFESLLAERDREVRALAAQNETLSAGIQDLQAKDDRLMFVEGCWVTSNLGPNGAPEEGGHATE